MGRRGIGKGEGGGGVIYPSLGTLHPPLRWARLRESPLPYGLCMVLHARACAPVRGLSLRPLFSQALRHDMAGLLIPEDSAENLSNCSEHFSPPPPPLPCPPRCPHSITGGYGPGVLIEEYKTKGRLESCNIWANKSHNVKIWGSLGTDPVLVACKCVPPCLRRGASCALVPPPHICSGLMPL